MLLFLLSLACWSGGECVVVPEPEARACEVNEDCALARVDCAQSCACAAVHVDEVEAIEATIAADCGTRLCDDAACVQDCTETRVAACVRGRCESFEDPSDSSGF